MFGLGKSGGYVLLISMVCLEPLIYLHLQLCTFLKSYSKWAPVFTCVCLRHRFTSLRSPTRRWEVPWAPVLRSLQCSGPWPSTLWVGGVQQHCKLERTDSHKVIKRSSPWSSSPGLKVPWRWLAVAGEVPALLMVLLLLFMPRSPRRLLSLGQVEQAEKALRFLRGKNYDTTAEILAIQVRKWRATPVFSSGFVSLRLKLNSVDTLLTFFFL